MFETAAGTLTPAERRRAATTAEIVEAAWSLCRRRGLAALSMRELARAVGMKAPSLYSYFDGKDAIYDAMFLQGCEALARLQDQWPEPDPARPRHELTVRGRAFFEFCTADPTRYQLLFQRTLPGFVPSEGSYAVAVAVLDEVRRQLGVMGVDEPAAVDLWTALTTGLTSQQLSNDPGGDRWARLVDRAIDMFCDHVGIGADPSPGPSAEPTPER